MHKTKDFNHAYVRSISFDTESWKCACELAEHADLNMSALIRSLVQAEYRCQKQKAEERV